MASPAPMAKGQAKRPANNDEIIASYLAQPATLPRLKPVETQHLSAVVEDCIEQLAVLGGIAPKVGDKGDDLTALVGEELSRMLEEQKLEALARQQTPSKSARDNTAKFIDNMTQMEAATRDLRHTAQVVSKSLKSNPSIAENLMKIQEERAALQTLMAKTLQELNEGIFLTLVGTVNHEKDKRKALQDTITREREASAAVRALQKELVEEKKTKEIEITTRTEKIAQLKDQLQELKAKTSMECKYLATETRVHGQFNEKMYSLKTQQLMEKKKTLQQQLELEEKVHKDIETYLRTYQGELDGQIQFWMEKHEGDTEKKQYELESLKNNRANDLSKLQELTDKYNEIELAILEDRKQKEEARQQAELDKKRQAAATRIQAAFRGYKCRQTLKAAKKPSKKGKKSGKKSGKKGGSAKKSGKKKK
eukprot:Colp12_sorted_trinity150504_noHs@34785